MALSININVNNSDISIKNSKTGAKKNIKSISAGNLNDMTDREFNISQKRKVARKQAMKLISDAWDKDNKAAQGIKDMESEKADIANINADLKSKLKDIDKSQKDLQELYGVHSESQEQKDLELLKKYQDNRNGVSNDKFSKEEIDRLKELQNEPLTEYQKKALMINSSKDAIRSQIDQNDLKAMNKTMSINNAKLEQLKSQDMLKAGDAADSIIEAADKDIFGMLVNEGKQNIDDNMKEQQEEAKKAEEEKAAQPPKEVGFLAVSVGDGLSELFKSLGVDYIIEGGQTMNPSTADILDAVDKVNAKTIFVLPNNKNIILAANQAAELMTDKELLVIPTKTIPQGITAVINFVPELSVEENEETMLREIKNVKTGQVTYAVRDTVIDDKEIKKDDFMGIGDQGIVAVGTDMVKVTRDMIAELVDEDSELISVYYGCDVAEDAAEALRADLEEAYPACDIELQYGGQPIYYYTVSVE